MSNFFLKKRLWRDSLTFCALCLLIYFFLSSIVNQEISGYIRPKQQITAVFNSNQLFIPHLYQDIFIQHALFSQWTLPPVPFLFPDALIFFVIAPLLHHHLHLAVLLSNAALAALYYLMLVSVGTIASGKSSKSLFRFTALLSLLLACGHLKDHEIMAPFWSSHFGSTVVVYLASLLLILKIYTFSSQKKIVYICLSLLSFMVFLTSLSDPFFFVLLLGSTTPALLALSAHKKIRLKLALTIFFSLFFFASLGFLCNVHDILHLHIQSFTHLYTNTAPTIHFSWDALLVLHKILMLYYAQNPIIVLFSLGFFVIGLRLLFNTTLNTPTVFIIICVAFSVLVTLFSSLFLDQDLLHANFLSLRHFQPAILLPTFLCLPLLLAQSKSIIHFTKKYYSFLIAMLISSILLFQPHNSLKKMQHIYPPLTRCLDNYAKQGQLPNKNGVAPYWDARVNTLLSKEHLNIIPINRYKKPYNWMSTTHDYEHKDFHFVIVRKSTFPEEVVIQRWGKPNVILGCPQADNYLIFVYNANLPLT